MSTFNFIIIIKMIKLNYTFIQLEISLTYYEK